MRPRRRLNPAFSPAFSGKLWTWQPVKLCFACWGYSITWYDKVKVKLNLMILDYDCPICKIPPSPPLKSGESWPLPFAKVGNLGLPLLKRGIEGDFHPPVYLVFSESSIALFRCINRPTGWTVAEGVGFEPTVPLGTTVFKTASLNHSDIPPNCTYCNHLIITTLGLIVKNFVTRNNG